MFGLRKRDRVLVLCAGERRLLTTAMLSFRNKLTCLIPTLLDLVDEGKIALRPAVELSYLTEDEQNLLADTISYMDATPSHDQAIRLRR